MPILADAPHGNSPVLDALAAGLDRHLDRVTRARSRTGRPAPQIRVSAPDIDYRWGDQETPFHAASAGKLATTALTLQLIERGRLTLDTPVTAVLAEAETDGLFDLSDETPPPTIAQLLGHTSGVADYLGGKVHTGPGFVTLLTQDPERWWDPADLLDFTRVRQRPMGRPGERFHYSDTGFVLLGRVVEEVGGDDFTTALRRDVFEPAGMEDSVLWLREPGPAQIAPLWIDGVERSTDRGLSCDWAGGGIVTTLGDLTRLVRAFADGTLLRAESVERAVQAQHTFRPGIRYGLGAMELRFEGFMPLFRGLPRPVGHLGVLGVHAFLDRAHDTVVAMNFHDTAQMAKSFATHVRIQQGLRRARRG